MVRPAPCLRLLGSKELSLGLQGALEKSSYLVPRIEVHEQAPEEPRMSTNGLQMTHTWREERAGLVAVVRSNYIGP